MSIRVDIPIWIDAEEFAERCEGWGIEFRKGKHEDRWCIFVKDVQAKSIALLVITIMLRELDEEIESELETYCGEE